MRTVLFRTLLAAALATSALAASAAVTVFHSKDDDGVDPATPVVLPPGSTHTLYLYLQNGGTSAGGCSTDATKVCAYDLILETENGVLFNDFLVDPNTPDAVYSFSPSRIRVNAVSALNGSGLPTGGSGPLRLGTLDIDTASAPGGTIELRASQAVDAALAEVTILPSTLISVPEPRGVIAIAAGVALLWSLSRFGERRA